MESKKLGIKKKLLLTEWSRYGELEYQMISEGRDEEAEVYALIGAKINLMLIMDASQIRRENFAKNKDEEK